MSTPTAHRAWVDESGSDHTKDPGTYVLAAAICTTEFEPEIREQIRRLLLPGQVKLHWRDESARRRTAIAHAVAACQLSHLVVVRAGGVDDRPERRRRRCLERLLFELELNAVTDVILESRGRADDRRDIELLNALRGQRQVSAALRLTHVVGRHEPMLWIPDAICGAVTSSRTGTTRYQQAFEGRIILVEI